MNTKEALEYINNYTWSSSRLGLDRIRELMAALGNPQKRLKFIHAAGSNGKGSVCAMLESILRKAGYKTGLYPSPYIEDFKESFQESGTYITDEELGEITDKVRLCADKMQDHPSQFEIKTAIAMLFFEKRGCDIVVLETGLGGELDSTNIIEPPVAAVITNIGYEHTEYLGDTLSEITMAKAGIIKPPSPVISYDNVPEVMKTLEEVCKNKGCTLHKTADTDIIPVSHNIEGQTFKWEMTEIRLPLLGRHQLKNAAVVLKTIKVLREAGYEIGDDAVKIGMQTVSWPARFEVLKRDPVFILDGGHNEQCAAALRDNIIDYFPYEKFLFILGILEDKNYSAMIDRILPYADSFICVTPNSPRALLGERLADIINDKGCTAVYMDNIEAAVKAALESEKPVLAFGSLYMAGEIRSLVRKNFK